MNPITHIVRNSIILPLTQATVDAEFVDIVGHLNLNTGAAYGSAALAENDPR